MSQKGIFSSQSGNLDNHILFINIGDKQDKFSRSWMENSPCSIMLLFGSVLIKGRSMYGYEESLGSASGRLGLCRIIGNNTISMAVTANSAPLETCIAKL